MKSALSVVFLSAFLVSISFATPHIYEKKYHGFTVWLDCDRHGAVAFHYTLDKDHGNISRDSAKFEIDLSVPKTCQPSSTASYRTNAVHPGTGTWDRGHLVPANHMDHSLPALKETFFVTNILPQQSTFNQKAGAWHLTETIAECYREIAPLEIWGGLIWGHDTGNDFFTDSHGVETPDFWWKLIYRHDTDDFIAWIFPNDKNSTANDIDNFIVTLRDIKTRVDFVPDFGPIEAFPDDKPDTSWLVEGTQILTCEGKSTSLS